MAQWRAWAAAMAMGIALVSSGPGMASAASSVGERDASADVLQSIESRSDSRGELTPNQLTAGRALTREEALAACGPAAAVALARYTGRSISLDAAVAQAREVGWTPERGMAGPASEVALLKRLGISATLEAGVDRRKIAREVAAGRPVIVRTWGGDRGHYLVAERYDVTSGKFDFGQSALVLTSARGRRWLTLDELATLGSGSPTHVIYLVSGSHGGGEVVASPSGGSGLRAMSMTATTPLSSSTLRAATAASLTVDAAGSGARLRAAPSIEATIVSLVADGTRLKDLGASTVAAGRTWRRVADADGATAWIADELLRPAGASR